MLSTVEKDRLLSRFDRNPPSPLAALLKCAAGILALVIVAAGPWMFLSASGPTAAPAAGEQTASQADRPVPSNLAESKRVFDERRERYEAARQATAAAATNSAGDGPLARE